MTPSFETWLVLGVLGFYLYDSAMLLYFNDLIFAERSGRWTFSAPSTRWHIAGKALYIPNPLSPDASLFRLAWSPDSQAGAGGTAEGTDQLIKALAPLRYLVLVLLVLMLFALPAVILILGTGLWFFVVLIATYITILLMLSFVYRRHDALGLSVRGVMGLVLESILCPPFAINMVRKITLKHIPAAGPLDFAQGHLTKEALSEVIAAVKERLNEELDLEAEDSHRNDQIKAYIARLEEFSQ